jgi:hypothetical protein
VQQIGAALSVAVLGSVLTTAYRAAMPADAPAAARDSIGDALRFGDPVLARAAREAFVDALATTSWLGVAGGIAAGVVAAMVLRPKLSTGVPEESNVSTNIAA